MALQPNSRDFPSQTQVPGFYSDEYVDPTLMQFAFPSSLWDERALSQIEEHLAVEAAASDAYESLTKADDPAVKYLAGLIAEDEHRHHKVLTKIAEALRAEVREAASPVQHVEVSSEQRKELLDGARRLLDMEKSDAIALKTLRRELRSAPDETMWPVLVEMMALDTDKHIRLLKAIQRHLGAHRFTR